MYTMLNITRPDAPHFGSSSTIAFTNLLIADLSSRKPAFVDVKKFVTDFRVTK